MNKRKATLKYDFSTASWEAIADWDDRLCGCGSTPDEAVESLRYQCGNPLALAGHWTAPEEDFL